MMRNDLRFRGALHSFVRQAPILYAVFLLLGIGTSLIAYSSSYRLIIDHYALWFVLNLAMTILFAGLCLVRRKEWSRPAFAISQALPVLAIAHSYLSVGLLPQAPMSLSVILIFCCFMLCYILSLQPAFRSRIYLACAILNTILLFLFLALLYFEAMFSTSDVHTTIQEVTSPQQTYRATLEVHDWGADSGGTNVIIEDLSTSIPVGFGRYSKLRIAYSGGWFAYRTIKLKWKDDQTLLINNKIYVVPNIHYSCFPSDFAF